MRRKVSRPSASVLRPLRFRVEASRWRRSWVCFLAANRGGFRRYRRWRPKPGEEWPPDRWELIVRAMIEQIGIDQLCGIIESVLTKMREEEIVAIQNSRIK